MNKQIDLTIFSGSKFRLKFSLDQKDLFLITSKGMSLIRNHAKNLVIDRLASCDPQRDGKQTPFKGHPVFKAQHATATCCRSCLAKWHGIAKGKQLSDSEVDYIVSYIMTWIEKQLSTIEPVIQKEDSQLSLL